MHGTPLAEGVVERFAQPAFRADGGSAEAFERFSQQPDERPAAVMPHPRPDFGARSVVVEVALDPVERGDLPEDPGEDGGAFLERGLELAPDVGEAGGAADFLAAPGLEFAVVDVGLVGVAEQGALEVLAHPFGEVAVLAAGLPVEDDVAGQTAVNPEVALPAAAGGVPVEAAHGRFVGADDATREHAFLHTGDEDAELAADFRGGVVHGVFGDVHAMAPQVELVLAVEGEVVEVLVGEQLGEQAGTEEAVVDDARLGRRDDRRGEGLVDRHVAPAHGPAEVKVAGFLFELVACLAAGLAPGGGVGEHFGGRGRFFQDNRDVPRRENA